MPEPLPPLPEPPQQVPLQRLEVEALDLGEGVRAVGCELLEPQTREPVTGHDAVPTWSAMLRALAAADLYTVDFFAHIRRVRDFCAQRGIRFHQPNEHVLLVPSPEPEQLTALFERFADSTFGVRAGSVLEQGDAALEGGLAERGVDAYQAAYSRYSFCAVCDFESAFLTLLSERLWASEVIRRCRAALGELQVEVARPA